MTKKSKYLTLKLVEPIKTLDELLYLCEHFNIEEIKGNDIILSGEITFRGEPRMVIGTIKDGKEEK